MPIISRKKKISLLILGIAIFAGIAHQSFRTLSVQRAEQVGVLEKGMTLPADFPLESLGGVPSGISEFQGKVIVINFWAGWCGPCLSEMPGLYDLQKRLEPKGFAVVGVNMDNDPADGMRTLKQRVGDAPFPMFKGAGSSLADRFGIEGLPFTVVLDRNRKILYARAGEVNWKKSEAVRLIEGTL